MIKVIQPFFLNVNSMFISCVRVFNNINKKKNVSYINSLICKYFKKEKHKLKSIVNN